MGWSSKVRSNELRFALIGSSLPEIRHLVSMYAHPTNPRYVQATFAVLLHDVNGCLGPGAYLKPFKLKLLESDNFCHALRYLFRHFYNEFVLRSVIDILTTNI